MTTRRFGPTAGAGVAVVEQDADKTITPAPTGVNCYVGKLYKGDVGDLNLCPTRKDMLKKVGGYVDGSEVPDAAFDFFAHSNGAGEMIFIRITDGTEVASSITVFGRHLGHGYRYGQDAAPTYTEQSKVPLFTVSARNGGRWGGRKRSLTGEMGDVATDLTETTLDTGLAMTVDEYAGADVVLRGVSKVYEVVSNTAAGVITVKSGSTMATDRAASSAPTQGKYLVRLDSALMTFPTQLAGTRRGLSLVFRNGQENEDDLFGMDVYEDEVLVKSYDNLSMDANSKWYIGNVVDDDGYITITILYNDAVSSLHRPADWYGTGVWSGATVTAQICHVRSVTSSNDDVGWVGDWTMPSAAGFSNRVQRQKIKLTFTSSTAFTVTSAAADGHRNADLGNGTVGTPYTPPNQFTPGFTVFAGAEAWAAADIIYIDVDPFPVDADGVGLLAGWYMFVDDAGAKRSKSRIESNTSNTITLSSAPTAVPDSNTAATNATTPALTFPLALTSLTLTASHYGVVTLDLSAGSPYADRATLLTAINTQWQAETGSTGDIVSAGTAANTVKFAIDDSGDDDNVGYESFMFTTIASNAVGIYGALGDRWRVEAPLELGGGYDGQDPDDADFTAAANVSTSPINRLFGRNKGLVKLATPGITSTTVQRTFLNYAEAKNYQYRVEIPSGTTDDSAVVDYINDTIGRNDFGVVAFPSYAYVPNQQGEGVVLRSLTGAIHGREALVAKNWQGYHKAAAGIDVTLPSVVRLPTGTSLINEELLNPVGVQVIKKARGNYIIWGDRTISLDPAWRWKHQREYMSHVENIFREEFDFIVFAINDKATRQSLVTTFQAFFLPEWQKRALRGEKFQDAVSIKIDDENNTNLTMANGDLNAEIKLRLADTVERFVITMGKAGIFEDLAS